MQRNAFIQPFTHAFMHSLTFPVTFPSHPFIHSSIHPSFRPSVLSFPFPSPPLPCLPLPSFLPSSLPHSCIHSCTRLFMTHPCFHSYFIFHHFSLPTEWPVLCSSKTDACPLLFAATVLALSMDENNVG